MGQGGYDHDRRELEKALRLSQRALPINVAFALLAIPILWWAHHFFGLPMWAASVLGFFAAFGAIGDAINIPVVRRKLRNLDRQHP